MNRLKILIKSILPKQVFTFFQPMYHYLLSIAGAILYRFPSKKLIVIGITGTKGKSSTAEIVNSILEEAGFTTALLSTIRFKIGADSKKNMEKMTMPGLFFVQKFLRSSVSQKCTHAIIEMTSEGVKQFRHKYIDLDALVFTNITPEHIESHGSFEKYLEAKLKLRDVLEHSPKKDKIIVSNIDDEHGEDFLKVKSAQKVPFSISDVEYTETQNGLSITYKDMRIESSLEGVFNVMNILSATKLTESLGVSMENIKNGVERISIIRGRVEHIDEGQLFDIVVDYAHTTDSLEKLYKTFENKKKICVLGNAGGGRDTQKRPEMGRTAEIYCEKVILTNEDPYDEDPWEILLDMKAGMQEVTEERPLMIMDRREAINKALRYAKDVLDAIVLISGKGTDPYIMEANGKKTPWDDATVVREELEKLNK